MTVEERLAKLEREIEEMKTVIRTKALCVLDDQGQERIKLAMTEDGPRLTMMDENYHIIWKAPGNVLHQVIGKYLTGSSDYSTQNNSLWWR